MGKKFTLFSTYNQYESALPSLEKPHVALTFNTNRVHFVSQSVIAKFNVTNPIQYAICNNTSIFSHFFIDGNITMPTTTFSFSSPGEHTVEYVLKSTTSTSDFTNAFRNCSMTVLYLPNMLTQMETCATNCPNLKYVRLPDGIRTMHACFPTCNSLKKIHLPDTLTTLGEDCFVDNDGLEEITIPNSVQDIGNRCFYASRKLRSVEIGSGVQYIRNFAFSSCQELISLKICAATPPQLGSDVFLNSDNCIIYVPSGSLNAYKSATNWSALASRIQPIA